MTLLGARLPGCRMTRVLILGDVGRCECNGDTICLCDSCSWVRQQRCANRLCTVVARLRADCDPSSAQLPDFGKKSAQFRQVRLAGLTASSRVKTQHDWADTDQFAESDQSAVQSPKRKRWGQRARLEGMIEELWVIQADRGCWGTESGLRVRSATE